ncbi:hypothetical protein T459_01847 [Capsicum annuum]|uniref:Uncharacterized protein n=1 Tax=Capsicum annuum TaxID=4072 RepID=A0A2G3AI98_CAPAN|nr:hypothetical protein T459_01847 [Capsicum annuum]
MVLDEEETSGNKVEPSTGELPVVEKEGKLSLCVAVGLTSLASTIKILGYARKVPLIILIDSGSTHSFVSPQVVKILKLPVQPCYAKLKVTVANGQVMYMDSY